MRIFPSVLNGSIDPPPSKSILHRVIICSLLSDGVTVIDNTEISDDILTTLECIKFFGADYEIKENQIIVKGISKEMLFNINAKRCFNVKESGSTFRFIVPLSLLSFSENEFILSNSLYNRPQNPFFDIFNKNNIDYKYRDNKLVVKGLLKPNVYNLDTNISSQFISGLLFALPLLNEDSLININGQINSKSYIDLTLQTLNDFKINTEFKNNSIKIFKNQSYISKGYYSIEPDYSNSAYIDCYNYIDTNNVKLNSLNFNTLQKDNEYPFLFNKLKSGFTVIDVSQNIDLSPILMVFSSLYNGGEFINTQRLSFKESDRGKCIVTELSKFGVNAEFYNNRIIIKKSSIHSPTSVLNAYRDHRILMALVFLLSITGGEIEGEDCVKKSFPSFFDKLKSLGLKYIDS